ncbi:MULTISPECIES: aminoglycoside phosphotransferase family protein [Marinobacter]|uniref:aminoglycoside phosphotransferase family protein n=1 Tax=Marinobacter TaxID=2742 RepID=UPI003009F129
MLLIRQLLKTVSFLEKPIWHYSIACISTSRPVYLVFDGSEHPTYVLRKLSTDRELHSHQIHEYLYRLVGDLVPRPMGTLEYAGEKYDVQEGVKGLPWFQIKSKFFTEDARAGLERKLWQTLKDFQSALRSDSNKITSFLPHEELRQVYEQYKKLEQSLEPGLEKLVGLAMNELAKMPDCPAIPQHGDFCLNNVIIDTQNITVIDFEDFEITKMPMYDHFTLALSLPSSSPSPDRAVKIATLEEIVNEAKHLGIPKEAIQWHFLHHILLRLGPWSMGEKRSTYRAWLKQVLFRFLESQTS